MATVTPIQPETQAAPIPERKKNMKKSHPNAGRKKKDAPPDPESEQKFFDKIKAVPTEDWGQRAFIYVYCTEPLCDLKTQGGAKFLFKSNAPITDLQKIMADYGSFKGYMTLNIRKPGDKQGDQVDRFDFEIYNPNYPPKIPRKVWIEDSRNEKWAALLPAEAPPPAANGTAPNLIDTMRAVNEMRRDIREELEDAQPIIPEPPDPIAQFKGVADVFKTLKGDEKKDDGGNMMLKMMEIQQKSTEATMTAMRAEMAEARKREHELQMKLIEIRTAPAQQDEITKKIVDKALDRVLNPENAEAIPLKSKGPWWGDMVHDLVVALPNSPVMANLSQAALLWTQASAMSKTGAKSGAVTPAPMPNAPPPRPVPTIDAGPGVPPAPEPHPNAAQQPEAPPVGPITPGMKLAPEQLAPFVGIIAEPLMNLLNSPDCDGARLADWCIVQKGQMQYDFVANQGPEILLQAIRLSPFWGGFQLQSYPAHPGFAHFEPQLKTLLADFCNPSDDEDDEEDQDNNDGKPEDILG